MMSGQNFPGEKRTQLNAGPWKNLDKKRAEDRDVLRARFEAYCYGHRAYHAGEDKMVPEWMKAWEGQEFRRGFNEAREMQRVANEVREEIRRL